MRKIAAPKINLFDYIRGNNTKTFFLFFFFIVFVVIVAVVISYAWVGNIWLGIMIGTVLALVIGLVQYYTGDKLILSLSRARLVPENENPFLHNTVEGLAIASGIPKPKIYILPDESINAFATGRNPETASVAITQGALKKLNRQEIEGVLAHELSHVKNYDIRIMLVASVITGIVIILADIFLRSLWFSGRSRDRGGFGVILLVIGIVLAILAPIFARLITLAISRNREFLADASAAFTTRYPKGLANALRKIAKENKPTKIATNATAHLFIANPLKKGRWKTILMTHPPIEERIRRLEAM